MENVILKFLAIYKNRNKKRFALIDLQQYLVKHYKGEHLFQEQGGYPELYRLMQNLADNNAIKAIAASPYNGLNPALKTKWQIISADIFPKWEQAKLLQYANWLDFTYYINNPAYQTSVEWEYIENIYRFLQERDKREWASVEERSLELFYDEKFLTTRKDSPKGKYGILSRLQLTNEMLKMKKYSEMFVYWRSNYQEINKVIILENHSTFFTYKRLMEAQGEILGFSPDLLIYGEGKKIENSLIFLEEIADLAVVKIFYFGDFDSEGLGIYYRLKKRYPHLDMNLHYLAYKLLVNLCQRSYPLGKQKKEVFFWEQFRLEIQSFLNEVELKKFTEIWENDSRIPQELITYERLLQVKI